MAPTRLQRSVRGVRHHDFAAALLFWNDRMRAVLGHAMEVPRADRNQRSRYQEVLHPEQLRSTGRAIST